MNQLRQFVNHVRHTGWGQSLAAFLIFASVVYLFLQTFGSDLSGNGFDFLLFYESAQNTANGISPYTGIEESPYSSYLYPPVLVFLIIPLTWLPINISGFIWFGLNIAALFGAMWLIESIRTRYTSFSIWHGLFPIVLLMLMMYVPIQNHIKNGQVNMIVLWLILLSLHQYLQNKPLSASISLALGLCIKPLTVVIVLFFFVRRAWTVLGLTVLLMVLFMLLPYFTMGQELFVAYSQYFNTLFYVFPADNFLKGNFQINTTVYDCITYFISYKTLMLRQTVSILLCLLMIGLDVFWLSKKQNEDNQLLVWSLYLLLALWVMPISEKHHLIILLPVVYLLGAWVLQNTSVMANKIGYGLIVFNVVFLLAKLFTETPLFCASVLVLFVLMLYLLANVDDETDPGAAL